MFLPVPVFCVQAVGLDSAINGRVPDARLHPWIALASALVCDRACDRAFARGCHGRDERPGSAGEELVELARTDLRQLEIE